MLIAATIIPAAQANHHRRPIAISAVPIAAAAITAAIIGRTTAIPSAVIPAAITIRGHVAAGQRQQ